MLVIAGSDSGGGAGIQADTWAARDHGVFVATAITAITAQHTRGVTAVSVVDPAMVRAQIRAVLDDMAVHAVKIGMLATAAVAHEVRRALEGLHVPVVLDPVMVATSGDRLLDEDAVAAIRDLAGLATVLTPNLPEAAVLAAGADVTAGQQELARAEVAGWAAGCRAPVLVTGGDAEGADVVDTLFRPGQAPRVWVGPRVPGGPFHGTGCTLASALAARLARGEGLEEAVDGAIAYVRRRLRAALRPGSGAAVGGFVDRC